MTDQESITSLDSENWRSMEDRRGVNGTDSPGRKTSGSESEPAQKGDKRSTQSIQSNTQTAKQTAKQTEKQEQTVASREDDNSADTNYVEPLEPNDRLDELMHTATITSTNTNTVPMKEKRGILAQVAILPEYEDPRNYPDSTKNIIVLVVAFAAICGPMGTSIMLPAIDDVVEDLNTQVSVVNVSVGIYLLSLGIFPLWWSAFSEKHGRRSVYLISFTLFVAFSIACAEAPSISSLIVFRVLSGGCSASVQAVGAGTIADLYPQSNRGKAMGWYYLGPLMGPFLAPILGGVVAQVWGWRATQWVLVIASGIADVMILFLLPETLRKQDDLAAIRKLLAEAMEEKETDEEKDVPGSGSGSGSILESRQPSLELVRTAISTISRVSGDGEAVMNDRGVGDSIMPSLSRLTTNRSTFSKRVALEQLQQELSKSLSQKEEQDKMTKFQKFKHESYEYLIRPLHSLVLLGYPPVSLVICFSSIGFALVYFFNITISYEYARAPYNFSSIIVGLCYIPNSVTYVLASLLGGKWNDSLLKKYAQTHNGELKPEARISWNMVLAIVLFPPSCLIFGWSLDKGVHWVVPLVGTSLFGFASMLVIGTTVTYLVDTLPGKGATGVALNNLIRQILAATGTFVAEPLIRAIGTGPLYTILMGIMFFASITLIYLKRRGDGLRQKYDLGAYYDKL